MARAPTAVGRRRTPVAAIAALGLATGVLTSSGDPGSDTARRIQVAHSWWTSEPEVRPSDAGQFGVPGRDGQLRAWYGLGQSVLLTPFDVAATGVARLASGPGPVRDRLRIVIVTVAFFSVLASLVLVAAYFALRGVGFSSDVAVLSALALQYATGALPYTQINQENSLLLLLDLLALGCFARWTKSRERVTAALGAAACGFALLVRLPALIEGLMMALAALLCALRADGRERAWWLVRRFASATVPVLLAFLCVDRAYQWHRFGRPWTTYIHLFGEQVRRMNPGLPESYPFDQPFLQGFLGPLLSPQRSVVLLEPLAVLATALLIVRWRSLDRLVRNVMIACGAAFVTLATFYARYYDWPGASAWGDRFVLAPVEVLSLLGVASVFASWERLSGWWRRAVVGFLTGAVIVQLSSIVFWVNLEEAQAQTWGLVWMPWQRWANIIAVASGKFEQSGLSYPGFTPRAIHPNFLPFLVDGYVPDRVAALLRWVWGAGVVLLTVFVAATVMSAWRRARGGLDDGAPKEESSSVEAGSAEVRW